MFQFLFSENYCIIFMHYSHQRKVFVLKIIFFQSNIQEFCCFLAFLSCCCQKNNLFPGNTEYDVHKPHQFLGNSDSSGSKLIVGVLSKRTFYSFSTVHISSDAAFPYSFRSQQPHIVLDCFHQKKHFCAL
jgi:hypothetical protein